MVAQRNNKEILEADYRTAKAIMRSAFSRRRLSNAQAGKVIGTLDELYGALLEQPQAGT